MIGRVITAGMIAGVTVAALGCASARAASSQQAETTTAGCTRHALKPITVGNQPGPIVITPDGKTAYVANAGSGTVTPIKTATNTALKPIKVGRQPEYLAITPNGRTVYAVNYTSDEGRGTVTPIRNCPTP